MNRDRVYLDMSYVVEDGVCRGDSVGGPRLQFVVTRRGSVSDGLPSPLAYGPS